MSVVREALEAAQIALKNEGNQYLNTLDKIDAALRAKDAEDVFAALDLDPESFRTEGGAVNVNKLRAAIVHPGEYLPDGHWLRSALNDEDAARYRWLRVRINSIQLWPAEKALDAMIDAAINARFDAARGERND